MFETLRDFQLSRNSLLLRVSEDVRLEVGRLSKLLVAAVERTDVGSVSSVNSNVSAQVEVQ